MIKPYLTVLLPRPSSSAELWRRDEERDEWERRGEKRQEEKDKCSEESWWTPSWTSGVAPALTEPVRWFHHWGVSLDCCVCTELYQTTLMCRM